VVAIFKRETKVGPKPPADASADVVEIIDLLVLLITMTEFLEVRDYFRVDSILLINRAVRRATGYPKQQHHGFYLSFVDSILS
jgi:hypothetical protein